FSTGARRNDHRKTCLPGGACVAALALAVAILNLHPPDIHIECEHHDCAAVPHYIDQPVTLSGGTGYDLDGLSRRNCYRDALAIDIIQRHRWVAELEPFTRQHWTFSR